MFHVYLLKSRIDGRYYIGQTDNIANRLARHNQGLVPATKSRRPLFLIGYETFRSRNEARFREYELKRSAAKRKSFLIGSRKDRARSSTDRIYPSEG